MEGVMDLEGDYRYVIIGAGAIGGTVGAVLTRAGTPAVLVARGRHAEVLAAAGIALRTPDGTFRTAVTTASRAEDVQLTHRDVMVFATKTQQLDAALQEWADQPVHGPHGVIGTAGRATAGDDRTQRRCRRGESAALFPSGIRCLCLVACRAPRTW